MRVLVAGATGALGAPLTRRLLANGHEVIGLSRTPAGPDGLHLLGAEPLIAAAMLRSTLCASNARARRELIWAPSAPTYRDGIRRMTASVRQSAPPHQRRAQESTI